jgi:chromosome segregation ATPase
MISSKLAVIACLAACLSAAAVNAREIGNIDEIQREARIVADIMQSALRNELRDGVRVTTVTSEYLARQGVLISVKLNAPWLVINEGDSAIEINGQLTLEEIPSMVQNILSELQIDVMHYEPEALGALREMREEQRQLRTEQRELRANLRQERRELVRADDDHKDQTQERIDALERELEALEAQSDALSADIDRQYEELRDYRGGSSSPSSRETRSSTDVDSVIAQTVCDYAATLKSLKSENFLTVAVRGNDSNSYFAFEMDHVRRCNRGDMRTDRLLELAYRYQG